MLYSLIFFLLLNLLVCNSSKILYKEDFLLGSNDWIIIGNNNIGNNGIKIIKESIFAPYSITRGDNKIVANRYIVCDDKLINVNPINSQPDDANLWYFKKVFEKPLNLKEATVLELILIPFVGNFTPNNLNRKNNPLVKLVNSQGLLVETNHNLFTQLDISNGYKFNIPLVDKALAYKKDTNIQDILSSLKEIHILGDWTRGYEVVGLDDVIFYG